MTRYVWRDGGFRDPATGEAMPIPPRKEICAPRITPDTPGYLSPVSGQWIEGRRARREDLKKHDCVEAGDMPRREFRDPKNARKYGLAK